MSTSTTSATSVPRVRQLTLERLALDELSIRDREALAERLGPEALVAERTALIDANRRFLERFAPDRLVPRIEERLQSEPPQSRPLARRHLAWGLGGAVAVAVAVLIAVLSVPTSDLGSDFGGDLPGARIKGLEPHLLVYRATANGSGSALIEQLEDGVRARAGDLIQLGYVAAGRSHGVVVSIDGSGAVTLHQPVDERHSTALETDGEIRLDFAFELDDAPRFERFFFVTADVPISVREVLLKARDLAREPEQAARVQLVLPDDWDQFSFTLFKE